MSRSLHTHHIGGGGLWCLTPLSTIFRWNEDMDEIVIAMRNMRNDACDRSILPFNRSRTTTHSEDRSVNFAFQHVTNDNS